MSNCYNLEKRFRELERKNWNLVARKSREEEGGGGDRDGVGKTSS